MKVVVNRCFGGFSLSRAGMEFMGLEWDGYGHCSDLSRHDPKLVACVEQLGKKANGACALLSVTEIPDDVQYVIKEYDGMEHVYMKNEEKGEKE